MFSPGVVGAHAEYHYLPTLAPKGNWVVSTFLSDESQRAWRVVQESGQAFMEQTYTAPPEERPRTHPMLVAGDPAWSDYEFEARVAANPDLRGTVKARDIVVKDRHWHLWAFTDTLELLWDVALRTGHYPSNYQATVLLPGWAQSR
jgi:hypothetical protein